MIYEMNYVNTDPYIISFNIRKPSIIDWWEVDMNVVIEKLKDADAESLYKFEQENRTYFEEMVPTRGDDYYHFENFKIRHASLLEEQAEGFSYFYLIKDLNGSILGRINLVGIEKDFTIGHLGYRVGKLYTGKGVAKKALELLLDVVRERGIQEVRAKTTTNNIASRKILEKNGFVHTETNHEEFEMNGQKLKFVSYTWMNKYSFD